MNKLANRFRLLRDYLRKASFLSGMPTALCVEVTNRCNMDCTMCPRGALNDRREDMSLELFKRIADEAGAHAEFIDFSFRGESLLNKNVFQMIRYARERDMHTSLQTNGMLLNDENCEALIRSGLDLLTVSIDAFLPETYSKIRRGGDFHRVVENTRRLIGLNRERNGRMMIVAQMIGMEENRAESKRFKDYWKRQNGACAKIKPFSSRAGLIDNKILHFKKGRTVRCSRIWKDMRICANGTVVPCCNDFLCRHPLGDLNTQTIREVWNGEAYVDLRRRHCREEFSLTQICKDCEFLKTNFFKQWATFVFDDLSVRKLIAIMDPRY